MSYDPDVAAGLLKSLFTLVVFLAIVVGLQDKG